MDLAVASLVFAAMMAYYRVPLTATMGFCVILIALQVVFTLAVVLLLSATNVFFRDVRHAVPFLVQVWLYATPIAFSMEAVPERYRLLYVLINPLAGLIDGFRSVVLHGRLPPAAHLAVVGAVSIGLLAGSYALFKHLESDFADVI